MSARPAWKQRAIRRFAACAVLVVIGLLISVFSDGGDAKAAGFIVAGLGLVLATVFIFLEVGLSEDRARASEDPPPPGGGP